LEGFKRGQYRILVATDIAARGIDVKGIELVINFDLPDDAENYIHRIGRTGRASHKGHAISFATPDQKSDVKTIERMINKSLPVASSHPTVPLEQFQAGSGSSGPRRGSNRGSSGGGNRSYGGSRGGYGSGPRKEGGRSEGGRSSGFKGRSSEGHRSGGPRGGHSSGNSGSGGNRNRR